MKTLHRMDHVSKQTQRRPSMYEPLGKTGVLRSGCFPEIKENTVNPFRERLVICRQIYLNVNGTLEFDFGHFILDHILVVRTGNRFNSFPLVVCMRFEAVVQQLQLVFVGTGARIYLCPRNGDAATVDTKANCVRTEIASVPCATRIASRKTAPGRSNALRWQR